jgi:hypothetical protein
VSPITERNIPQVADDKKKNIKEMFKYMPMQDSFSLYFSTYKYNVCHYVAVQKNVAI